MNGSLRTYAQRLRAAADALDELLDGKPAPTHKDELLKHYAEGRPTSFMQFDGFAQIHPDDSVMLADEAGHCVMWSETHELRRSHVPVRVQIRSGTPAAEALALLKKITASVEHVIKERGESAFHLPERPHAPSAAGLDDFDLPF